MLCMTSQDERQSQSRKSWKRLWGPTVSRYGPWRNLRANRHHTRGTNRRWLDGGECFGTSARQRGRRPRRSVPENKWTLDSRAEGFWLLNTAFDFLYDMGPSKIKVLKLKQMLVPYSNIFREMKKQKSQTEITVYCLEVTRSVSVSPACLPPALPLPPLLFLRQQDQPVFFLLLSLLSVKMTRVKTFMMIHSHLMNSK